MSPRSTDPFDPAAPEPRLAGHLVPERLAALADGEPAAAEAAHLEACAACRRERDAHRAVLGHAHLERGRVAPPLTDWSVLAGALRAEGLVCAPAAVVAEAERPEAVVHPIGGAPRVVARRRLPAWAGRAAAALLLVVGGAAVGRASAGASLLPEALPWTGRAVAAADARVAAILADSAQLPRSQAEAIAVLTRAERDYRLATQYLAELTTATPGVDRPEDYQRRLAVMDEVAALTRAALYEAPHDPVLNQYYLASLSAREATLRQLGTVLPAGAQINRF